MFLSIASPFTHKAHLKRIRLYGRLELGRERSGYDCRRFFMCLDGCVAPPLMTVWELDIGRRKAFAGHPSFN